MTTAMLNIKHYPYGGIFGEGVSSSVQPYKFGGKELDRMNGLDWSDFGARMLDSSSGLWGSIDPMAEKYHSISPYAYCAGNPILYVDPSGMDWFTATYNGETFYFFDKRVKSQEDIATHYGADNQASYLGISSNFSNSGDKFSLNKDGSFEINGKVATAEYNKEGSMHIGNDTFTDMGNVGENFRGSIYTGGNNPMIRNSNKYSYAIPPSDEVDYAAYKHDRDYDALNVSGAMGVLLYKTTRSDIRLVNSASQSVINNTNVVNALSIGAFFTTATAIKTLLRATPFSLAGSIYYLMNKE